MLHSHARSLSVSNYLSDKDRNFGQRSRYSRSFHASILNPHVGGLTGRGLGSPEEDSNEIKSKLTTREKNSRIVKALSSYVWPTPTSDEEKPHTDKIKSRVKYSVALMLGGKLVTIQVPFLFKHLVDSIPTDVDAVTAAAVADPTMLPLLLVLGYGVSKGTAAGMQQLRNAVFAHVAQVR